MNREIKITPPNGYIVDEENSTFECIKFKPFALPKTWEELHTIKGYYSDSMGYILETKITPCYQENKNVFPTKQEAEASIALAQLCQLRDRYNNGWKPNYNNNEDRTHCILFYKNKMLTSYTAGISHILTFKTATLCDNFMNNFKDLIEIAKPLL